MNYVRDRRAAQVHVLVTTESSGGGGRMFTLAFIGQEEFVGTDDVLEYTTSKTDTDDEEREGFARVLRSHHKIKCTFSLPADRRHADHRRPPGEWRRSMRGRTSSG